MKNQISTPPPRLKGRVGNGDDGKFYFEISMWDFYGQAMVGEPWTIGPWETEEKAHEEMKRAIKLGIEAIETYVDGKPSGKYFDMKAGGVLRSFGDEH